MKTLLSAWILLATPMLPAAWAAPAGPVSGFETKQRFPLKFEELPEPVKKALSDVEYREWKVEEIYLVQEEKKIYEITLSKGKEKQVIKMDENGNRPGR